jgi:thioredoxin 1
MALSAADFEREVLNSEVPVLLDFWAEWCGPCKAIGPAVEELAQEYAGRAKVYKVNVDEEGELAMRFGIMSIPSLLIFKGGKKVDQMVGAAPKAKLAEFLTRHI